MLHLLLIASSVYSLEIDWTRHWDALPFSHSEKQDARVSSVPRYIVAGLESTSKSAVVEALTGLMMPSHPSSGTFTPIEIDMEPWSHFEATVHQYQGHERSVRDLNDLARQLETTQYDRSIMDAPTRVIYRAPSLRPFSIVDLPGLLMPNEVEDDRVFRARESMTNRYLKQANAVLIAVLSCNKNAVRVMDLVRHHQKHGKEVYIVMTNPHSCSANEMHEFTKLCTKYQGRFFALEAPSEEFRARYGPKRASEFVKDAYWKGGTLSENTQKMEEVCGNLDIRVLRERLLDEYVAGRAELLLQKYKNRPPNEIAAVDYVEYSRSHLDSMFTDPNFLKITAVFRENAIRVLLAASRRHFAYIHPDPNAASNLHSQHIPVLIQDLSLQAAVDQLERTDDETLRRLLHNTKRTRRKRLTSSWLEEATSITSAFSEQVKLHATTKFLEWDFTAEWTSTFDRAIDVQLKLVEPELEEVAEMEQAAFVIPDRPRFKQEVEEQKRVLRDLLAKDKRLAQAIRGNLRFIPSEANIRQSGNVVDTRSFKDWAVRLATFGLKKTRGWKEHERTRRVRDAETELLVRAAHARSRIRNALTVDLLIDFLAEESAYINLAAARFVDNVGVVLRDEMLETAKSKTIDGMRESLAGLEVVASKYQPIIDEEADRVRRVSSELGVLLKRLAGK